MVPRMAQSDEERTASEWCVALPTGRPGLLGLRNALLFQNSELHLDVRFQQVVHSIEN
jgi:hypothetical protein